MQRRSLAILALAAAATVATVGCSSDETTTPTTTSTTTTTAPRNVAVDTPNGQVSLSLDGELPPNWPSDFPVPSGATAAGSGSLGGTDDTVMVGVYTTSESAEDTFDYYRNSAELSIESPSTAGAGNAFVGKLSLTDTYEGSVTVAGAAGTTTIVVVLEASGSGSSGTVPGTVAP